MSSVELPPVTILKIARISQYLAHNAISAQGNFKGQAVDPNIARLIYSERRCVQIRYDTNPNDPTLQATANYLFALLGKYGLLAQARLNTMLIGPPTVTGPNNQTVNVGQNATFTVAVGSTVPYTVQWYDYQDNPIPGATGLSYTVVNAQLTDNSKTYYVKATNAGGQVTSSKGVLVVNLAIAGSFAYLPNDPYPTLKTGVDNFSYQISFPIVTGQDFVITMPPLSSPNQYLIVRVPSNQPLKANWFNDQFNNGQIPDFDWQPLLQFGGFTYYASRQALSLNTSATLKLQA